MFTWICPKCGREVPPAYTECPDCKAAENAPPPETPAAAVPPSPAAPPPVARPEPTPPAYTAPHPAVAYAAAPPSRGLPTWLLTLLFAFAFVGLGSGIYWFIGYLRAQKPSTTVESAAAKPGAKTHPLQKYIEVTGVRFVENAKKQSEVRFLVINHSPAEIDGLSANVTLWARTQKSEEEAAGTFDFKTDLKPWESRDLTTRLTSKLKIYELPDWQNISTDVQITAPGEASGGSPPPR